MTTPAPYDARFTPLQLLLALANFSAGIAAFSVIGVLSPIAAAFQISLAQAGALMTVYAVVYAVSSPVLVSASGTIDRAQVLITGLALLALGAVIGMLAKQFEVLLVARAVMAVGAGLVTPVTASIALATAAPEHRGRTLARIYGGLTLAQAIGVPASAWLGYAFGWRTTFGIAAAFAALAAAVLYRTVPRGISVQPTSLTTLERTLATPHLLAAVAYSALLMAATFSVYTYLAVLLETRYGFGQSGVSAMLLVFGFGAVAGNAMGGFLADRFGRVAILTALCVLQMLALPALTMLHLPVLGMGLLIGIWSVSGWSFNVPQQARLASLDTAKTPVLLALHAAAIYVGSSVGSAVGGKVLVSHGLEAVGVAGAGLSALALASLGVAKLLAWTHHRRSVPALL